ncbi:efflux RND transporter periplasmic adaptor subunit [Maribacter sp. PR1]|jgi:RND family efflux transporter MFP subunit|uniref:Efflux RND transporter periplasmic adaptor subunit n=1 Tax=Maribacter cobaltidurans TaxID=1178778 RepID=A0ABU7IWC8_9FLAO|nr:MULTISPECIES: efflux RND transporter periplasmic adaptor subunit [Maribacter]MCR9264339.1 efflux RND transporter periplasmic adaptor subunit [Flavobacteriaceae bacterium]MDC6389915.1 efflux RND transporter periplasmic adaptor subunit [Maribacter sp. PR1]MEE1977305.1 efflux RND transporter periplasmic adaptor subunit [Maribacter cobaltidurans]|tara:strand:- start:800 stop:1813 length:1014 start_codon:yes stop_codon:yes gene_type:complete
MKQIITLTTLALLVIGCSEKKETVKEVAIPKVTVKKIKATEEKESLTYSGTIEADNTVSLGFSVPGRISKVNVQEGQKVKRGQLLASIDQTTYKNAFDIANAGLEQANDNFKRLSGLYEKGSLPERDFIAVKVAVAQANANKNLAAKNLTDTKLYAPFSGIITAKMTEMGATAAPGVPAFTVMKTDKVYAKASIAESEISKLKMGTDAEVEIASLNETFNGKVAIINPSADAITRTFNVKVRLDNKDDKLLPGMISKLKINTGNTVNVITVPSESVVRDANDILYVFVVKENKAIKKRVSLGSFKGNEVIVTNGLSIGDAVVIAGNKNLKDGQTVSL